MARLSAQVRDLSTSREHIEDELDALAAPDAPADDERTDAEAEASIQRTMAFYDDQLAGQAADPSWAPQAEAALEARVLGWQSPGLSGLSVECRASLCRVEMVYDPGQVDPNALADALGAVAPWPSNAFYHVDLDTDHVATAWLTRSGVSLPGPG